MSFGTLTHSIKINHLISLNSQKLARRSFWKGNRPVQNDPAGEKSKRCSGWDVFFEIGEAFSLELRRGDKDSELGGAGPINLESQAPAGWVGELLEALGEDNSAGPWIVSRLGWYASPFAFIRRKDSQIMTNS